MTVLWCLWAFSRRRKIVAHNRALRDRLAEVQKAQMMLMQGIAFLGPMNSRLLIDTLGVMNDEAGDLLMRINFDRR